MAAGTFRHKGKITCEKEKEKKLPAHECWVLDLNKDVTFINKKLYEHSFFAMVNVDECTAMLIIATEPIEPLSM